MIASGIILAFNEYCEQLAGIPVVVRLRGTNEEDGQRMVSIIDLLYPTAVELLVDMRPWRF